MLRRLGLSGRLSNEGPSGSSKADFYDTEGPTGMKIIAEPDDPTVEYVLGNLHQ